MHPEPEVAMVFKKTTDDQSVDLIEVEKLLRKLLTKVSEHLCIVLVYMYMGIVLYWYCLCLSLVIALKFSSTRTMCM